MSEFPHTDISGIFVKILCPDDCELVLQRHSPARPAARYNRRGENALYLSADERSARVAMEKYKHELTGSLVLAEFEVEPCQLVDLRHENASDLRLLAQQDWRGELAEAREPTSWQLSDTLRSENEIGLVDPSRKKPDVWHITLFRWNEKGAPQVKLTGKFHPISFD